MARLVRADFLSLRERDFVEASRALGASNSRIIVRHLMPNAVATIIVNSTLDQWRLRSCSSRPCPSSGSASSPPTCHSDCW